MANHASAEKRARQDAARYAHNKWYRGRYRTFVKRARSEMEAGDADAAAETIRLATQALDRAARRRIIHPKKASRLKSRLAKQHAKLS